MPSAVPAALRDGRVLLVLVAVAAIAIRLVSAWVWASDLPLEGDQVFYHHQGQDLADGVGFTYRHPADERITTAVHPPMHGGLLGAASLVGADGVGHHRAVGALLGGATVLVGGLAARRLAGDGAGMAAAVALAVVPTLWINDSLVLSESSYAFAVALVLLAAAEFSARPDRWRAVLLGGAVGLAMLARAEAALLCVVLVVPLVAVARLVQGGARARTALLVWAAVGTLAVGGPWVVRNLTSFERPVVVSSGAGFVLEIANCDATYQGDSLGWWSTQCDRTPWQPGDETATESAKRATGIEYMTANADRLPVVVGARVARMWDFWSPSQSVVLNDVFERRGEATSRAAIYVWWAMLPLAAGGAYALRRRPEVLVAYGALAVTTTVAAAMSFGITRYRTGLEVGFAVLAGIGVAALVSHLAQRSNQIDDPDDPDGSEQTQTAGAMR